MTFAKYLIPLAAIPAIAFAVPASAQPGYSGQQSGYRDGGSNAGMSMSGRINQLQMRFQAGVQSGSITRREATALRQQLRQLTMLDRRYAMNGYTGREEIELQRRTNDVRMAIRRADRNNRARWDGYDREDGYGRDGQWSNDRGDNRYPQQPQQRTGLGGLIDTVLGGGGLRVGQQMSGDLRMLDGGYRDQYRDGNGSFYRTDGRQIYEIDARSQTVVRIYPMNR